MTLDEYRSLPISKKLNEINRLAVLLELTYSAVDEGYEEIFAVQLKRLERELTLGYYYLYDNTWHSRIFVTKQRRA